MRMSKADYLKEDERFIAEKDYPQASEKALAWRGAWLGSA